MSDVNLWDHQVKAIEESKSKRDMALFWEMGTGKTLAVIRSLEERMDHCGTIMPTLVLCPSVVVQNWADEINKYSTKLLEPVPLSGPVKKRTQILKQLRGQGRLFITNYEALNNKTFLVECLSYGFKILVCDESQRLKSHNSQRSKATALIAERCEHRYILSGTPVLNSPMDLFQQFKVLDKGETFGKNFFIFRSTYFENKNANAPSHVKWPDWHPRPGAIEQFNKIVSEKASRVVKSECLDLPPFIEEKRYVELGADQAKAYKEMKNDFITFILDAKNSANPRAVIAEHAATKMLRLQQIVSGYVRTDDGVNIQLTPNPRLTELEALLEDLTPNHKVIVWACFVENYEMIKRVCHGLKIRYCEIHGGIADKQPQINIFRQEPSVRVCIANPAAAGLGINLVEASYSIYYSKSFNLEHNFQSEARNYRGGSEIHEKVTRIDLIARNTVDELVNQALKNKQSLSEIILDASLDSLQAML